MATHIPTLVTYRSAIVLRDAGIRYAFQVSIKKFCILVAFIAFGAAQYLQWTENASTIIPQWGMMAIGLISIAIAAYLFKMAEFPHFPELTIEEIDTMRHDMGLPPEVFEQTSRRVLHGSFDDHLAASEHTEAILAKIRRAASE